MTIMFIKAFGIIVAFPSTTIMLTNSASSLRILGTLNGFATMFSGMGRAIGPAMTGYVFSWGVDHHAIGSAYYFLAFVSALGAIPVFMIVEGDGPTASAETSPEGSDDEDDDDSRTLLGVEGSIFREDTMVGEDDEQDRERQSLLGDLKGNGSGYSTMSGK